MINNLFEDTAGEIKPFSDKVKPFKKNGVFEGAQMALFPEITDVQLNLIPGETNEKTV